MFEIGARVRFHTGLDDDSLEGFVTESNDVFTWVDWGFGPEKEPTADLEGLK